MVGRHIHTQTDQDGGRGRAVANGNVPPECVNPGEAGH